MTEGDVYAKLTDLFRDILGDDHLVLTPELSAADVPEWDSLSHVTLLASIEAEFKIKFKSAETEELKNVGELVSVILAKAAR